MSGHIKTLIELIRKNPKTNQVGLLTTQKVVEIDQGVMSYKNDRELLALVLDDPRGWYYYGHVLRMTPAEDIPGEKPMWAALIINAMERIDADEPELVFRRYQYWVQKKGRYTPCHAQSDGDVFALTDTYEAAVDALLEMVRRFDIELRFDSSVFDGPAEVSVPLQKPDPANSPIPYILDMRCFDAYGGLFASWDGTDETNPESWEGCP